MSIIYEKYTVSTIAGPRSFINRQKGAAHTPECRAARSNTEAERERFFRLYPSACRDCGANYVVGSVYDYDTGYDDPTTCSTCDESGQCPLCGVVMEDEAYEKCDHCGWEFFGGPHALPEYECWGCKSEYWYEMNTSTLQCR